MFSASRLRPLCLASLLLLSLPLPGLGASDREAEGRMIIDHWLKVKAVDSELAFLEMRRLQTDGTVETRRLLAVFRRREDGGADYLMRLMGPEDVRGVALLAREDASGAQEQFIYLPAVGQLRELSGEAQLTPFLGSDLSYEDLRAEVPSAQQYERRPDRFIHGAECYVVRATPLDPATTAYAYRDLYLNKRTFDLERVDFVGEGDTFLKFLAAYDYDSPRIAGESTRPQRAVMTDVEHNTSTILTVIQSRVNRGVGREVFSADAIEGWSEEAFEDYIFEMFLEVSAAPVEGLDELGED